MYDFEGLKKEVVEDSVIDENLSYASIRTAKLHAKYLNMHLDASRALSKAIVKEKKVYKRVWDYYSNKASAEVYAERPLPLKILKSDLDLYISNDREMIEVRAHTDDMKKLVLYLEKVLDQIKSRGFLIQSAVNYEMFKGGR